MAKIALIGPVYPYRGGIAHYTTLLDRALRAAGHNMLLISFRRQYPSFLFPGRSDKDPSQEPIHAVDSPLSGSTRSIRSHGCKPPRACVAINLTCWCCNGGVASGPRFGSR